MDEFKATGRYYDAEVQSSFPVSGDPDIPTVEEWTVALGSPRRNGNIPMHLRALTTEWTPIELLRLSEACARLAYEGMKIKSAPRRAEPGPEPAPQYAQVRYEDTTPVQEGPKVLYVRYEDQKPSEAKLAALIHLLAVETEGLSIEQLRELSAKYVHFATDGDFSMRQRDACSARSDAILKGIARTESDRKTREAFLRVKESPPRK